MSKLFVLMQGQSGAKNHVAIDTPVHRSIFYAHEPLSTALVGLEFKCNVVNGRVTRSIYGSYNYQVVTCGQDIYCCGKGPKNIKKIKLLLHKKTLNFFLMIKSNVCCCACYILYTCWCECSRNTLSDE